MKKGGRETKEMMKGGREEGKKGRREEGMIDSILHLTKIGHLLFTQKSGSTSIEKELKPSSIYQRNRSYLI